MHSKNIRTYLDTTAGIAALLPQAERLIALREVFAKLIPQQLLRSSSIVNYKQGYVVIFVENSSIAAKLKLLSPRLVNEFCNLGWQVTGIRLEVQPREITDPPPRPKQAKLSAAGVKSLASLAEQLPNSKLKQLIKEMAERRER